MTTDAASLIDVCALGDLSIGTPKAVDAAGTPVALVRTADREVHAINDICTHANVSLAEGEFDARECALECWLHGSLFDLRTGAPLSLPATEPVAVYPVIITDHDRVMIDISATSGTKVSTS